jgi:hypothetical protein
LIGERPRRFLLNALATACGVCLLLWIAWKTEWVEVDVPRPLKGEAASDPLYVLRRILQGTGVSTVRKDDLSQLPPPGATLLLSTWIWNLLPERDRALRTWVEQGGHLVIDSSLLRLTPSDATSWIPVQVNRRERREKPDQEAERPASAKAPSDSCHQVVEPDGMAPAYPADNASDGAGDGSAAGLKLCLAPTAGWKISTRQPPLWALASDGEMELLRVPYGAGTVTVVGSWSRALFGNATILVGDNALISLAALQAHPGAEVWLVAIRGAQPLPLWLWSRAGSVLVLALVALALWLWRATARFGPVEPSRPLARRSMGEQIAGTALFLWRRSPNALHAAQLRALHEAAALRLRHYARLGPLSRAAAIAAATAVDEAALGRAVDPAAARDPRALARLLALLETVRRRLLREPGAAAPIAARPGTTRAANVKEADQ